MSPEAAPPPTRRRSRFGTSSQLLALSVVFHAVYLYSIFDIYFVSPVVSVPLRYGVGANLENGGPGAQVGDALAKRVVLIVGDGLRADKLFQTYPQPPFPHSDPLPPPMRNKPSTLLTPTTTTPAPFLRGLIQSGKAAWGVSHTRVPTESRPGHVALIGGLYEDVSAVTRGWQANPVPFDSVFNQSIGAWSFGSPDILPMFRDGARDPTKIRTWTYGDEMEDFSKDATELDLWVLRRVREMFRNATRAPGAELDRALRREGNVFFLHLLGLDTTGHSYRPHGPEYQRNIRVLDYVVQQTVGIMDAFYGHDDQTAFVLTADHGMSSKGNHGDGDPDNTRTPVVVWGRGVQTGGSQSGHDEYSEPWGLAGPRKDIEQADIAALMSVLGGLPLPANSAGQVPLDYLCATPKFKAQAAFANAKQIMAEFTVKSDQKAAHALSFRPYPPLSYDPSGFTKSYEMHKAKIENLIASGEYAAAQRDSMELVKLGLDGLRYFQTYDWFVLRTIVTLGYIGFIAFSLRHVVKPHVQAEPTSPPNTRLYPAYNLQNLSVGLGALAFVLVALRFAIERAPWTYYLYLVFPCFFWSRLLSDYHILLDTVRPFITRSTLLTAGAVMVTLEGMVVGYFHREVFAAILLAMGWIWPKTIQYNIWTSRDATLFVYWQVWTTLLAIFPLLPVERGETLLVVLAGGVWFLVLSVGGLQRLGISYPGSPTLPGVRKFVAIERGLIIASMITTWVSAKSLQQKKGLPPLSQAAGWLILSACAALPAVHGRPSGQPVAERAFVVLASFCPAFIILSLSYEALFYAIFLVTLAVWVALESSFATTHKRLSDKAHKGFKEEIRPAESNLRPGNKPTRHFNPLSDTARIALFFLVFLHVAFFGVGNVASISSFYLEPVYRLIPIFAPFPMAALLLYKLLIPFVALAIATTALNRQLGLPPFVLFILSSTLADVLTLNFFFLVTDNGSWLEIGSSISNFSICSLLSIFNTALFLLGEYTLEGAI